MLQEVRSMDAAAEKKRLREWAKARRGMLSPEEKRQGNAAACRRVWGLAAYQKAKTVFCYVATSGEIDVTELFRQAWKDGKRVAVPKCGKNGQMDAREITSLSSLSAGRYGILEPEEDAPVVPPEEIGLAVIPCLACDRRGYRLGYGGGYYDRYLPKITGVSAVLCWESLLLDEVPKESFDCRVDWVITERKTAGTRKRS